MRIASAGHAFFGATMIIVGILGLIKGDYTAVWQPVAKDVPASTLLIYLCAFISVASGLGLFWNRTASVAGRLLFGYLLFWLLVFGVPSLVRGLTVDAYWSLCKTVRSSQQRGYCMFGSPLTGIRSTLVSSLVIRVCVLQGYSMVWLSFLLAWHIFNTSNTRLQWFLTGCRRIWHGRISPVPPSLSPAWRSSSGCVHGWQPRSRRCRWEYSSCWCGFLLWLHTH